MKKVKIMLTAITVFAVVGGALAFKANSAFKLYKCNTQTDRCVLAGNTTYTVDLVNGQEFQLATITNQAPGGISCAAAECTSTTTITAE